MRKPIALFLSAMLLVQMLPASALDAVTTDAAADARYSDTTGHWAEDSIEVWSELDIIHGADGQFNPDASITRADLTVILDQIMNYQVTAENTFADLGDSYYTEALLRANAAGIIYGYEENVRPTDAVTREEMIVMLARALHIDGIEGDTNFADNAEISSWALPYVAAFAEAGIVVGSEGSVNPQSPVTRAETISMIDRSIALLATDGSYEGDVAGTVVVNSPDVTLSNMIISGDLIIAEGVGDGDVTLEDVVVEGDVIVKGGGENSIHFNNVTVNGGLVVSRIDGVVRIVASGTTTISVIEIDGQTVIQATDLSGGLIGSVVINTAEEVLLQGTFSSVSATVPGVNLSVDGTIETLVLPEGGSVNGQTFEAGSVLDADSIPAYVTSSTSSSSGSGSSNSSTPSTTTYAVTTASVANGTISASTSAAEAAQTVTVTATPDADYLVDLTSATVVSTAYPEDSAYFISTDTALLTIAGGSFAFEMPAYAVTVDVAFQSIDSVDGVYTITNDTALVNGALSVGSYAMSGDDVTVTLTPDSGYMVDLTSATVVSTAYPEDSAYFISTDTTLLTTTGGSFSFVMPDYAVTVDVAFQSIDSVDSSTSSSSGGSIGIATLRYGVTTAFVDNGTISASTSAAKATQTVTVTATPDSGYMVDLTSAATVVSTAYPEDNAYFISTDTTLLTIAGGSFTFEMPAYAVTVDVAFQSIDSVDGVYTITNDTALVNGALNVDSCAVSGDVVTVTLTPDSGYMVDVETAPTVVSADSPENSDYFVALITYTGGSFSFVMPEYDVELCATFTESSITIDD